MTILARIGTVASSRFSAPPVVQNAAVWLDAADATTITESGGAVSQWNNKGSLGNFTQGTAALQPTTGVSTLNSLNVIDFAGDYLVSADSAATYKFLHDGNDYIIAAVWKPGTTADPNAIYGLLGTSANASGNVGVILTFDDRVLSSSNNEILHFVNRGVGGTWAVRNETGNGFMSANVFNVTTVFADPDNATINDRSKVYLNAGSATTNIVNSGTVSTSDPSFTLHVGSDAASPLTGSIAELVIVSGADATDANRQIIRDYLNTKWAVY